MHSSIYILYVCYELYGSLGYYILILFHTSLPSCCCLIIGIAVIRTGWHFSYFASPAGIINKLQNFAHQEYNREQYKNASRIQELIDQKKDIFGRANTLLEHVEVEAIEHLPDNFQMLIELFNK